MGSGDLTDHSRRHLFLKRASVPRNPELELDPVVADSIRADGHLSDLLSVASYGSGCLYIYIHQNAFPILIPVSNTSQ